MKEYVLALLIVGAIACGPPPHANKGWGLLQAGQFQAAISEFEASTQHENCSDGFLGLYHSYRKLGQQARAIQFLEEGIRRYPKASSLYAARGHCRLDAHRFEEAIQDFELSRKYALENEPRDKVARNLINTTLDQLISDARMQEAEYLQSKR